MPSIAFHLYTACLDFFSILSLKEDAHSLGSSMEQVFYVTFSLFTRELPWTHKDLPKQDQAKQKPGHFSYKDWLSETADISLKEREFLEAFSWIVFLFSIPCAQCE